MIFNTVRYESVSKLAVHIPSQSGSLTYNGGIQSPLWDNFDSDLLEISGQTSGTSVGTYTAIFSIKNTDDYAWEDGTENNKSVEWSIQNATTSSVPTQSGALTYNGSTQSPTWNNYDTSKLNVSGTTSATDAGTYTVTFTPKSGYQWPDGTSNPQTVTWTIGRASITSSPSQSNTLTYNGINQSPTWNNYDTSKMNISGTTTETNAGTYIVKFTPTSNYQWSDGSTAFKNISWSIGKATATISVSPTSLSITNSNKTATISVTSNSSGTVTAISSNTNYATVSVSSNTVNVTGVASGNPTITVKVSETTNYTSASKTVPVTVTLAKSLENHTWAEIESISQAGNAANYFSIGDTKSVTLNSRITDFELTNFKVDVFIIGIDHNKSIESPSYHAIHFQFGKIDNKLISFVSKYGYYGEGFIMCSSTAYYKDWDNSSMRNFLHMQSTSDSTLFPGILPYSLKSAMRSVTKYNWSDRDKSVVAGGDNITLISEYEIFGKRSYANANEQNYQQQYDYYKAGNSKIHYMHNNTITPCRVWTRSAAFNSMNTFIGFCEVDEDGESYYEMEDASQAISPIFFV